MLQSFDFGELVKRAVKYIIEGIMVAIAAYVIPKKALNIDEIALISLSAATIFSILDTYIPSMGVTARSGAGFGIGANLVKFPGGFFQLVLQTGLNSPERLPENVLQNFCIFIGLRVLIEVCTRIFEQ